MTSKYCLISDVTDLTNIQAKHWFSKDEHPDTALNNMLNKWISLASEAVNSYCNNKWDDIVTPNSSNENTTVTNPCPETVRLATSMLVANILAFAQTRRDTPIIQKDNWNVDFVQVEFFTEDIKELLDPYCKERPSIHSDYVDIFCVHGGDC